MLVQGQKGRWEMLHICDLPETKKGSCSAEPKGKAQAGQTCTESRWEPQSYHHSTDWRQQRGAAACCFRVQKCHLQLSGTSQKNQHADCSQSPDATWSQDCWSVRAFPPHSLTWQHRCGSFSAIPKQHFQDGWNASFYPRTFQVIDCLPWGLTQSLHKPHQTNEWR